MPVTTFLPGWRSSVFVQRLTVASQPPPRWLFSWRTVKPTRQWRLTVTSARKDSNGIQSGGTLVVVMVGHWPPAKVILRLCLPEVACSFESSHFAAGSLALASGRTRLDQALRSPSFSKSKRTLVDGLSAERQVRARKARRWGCMERLLGGCPGWTQWVGNG